MKKWEQIPDNKTIKETIRKLEENGFETYFVENRDLAIKKVLEVIPKKAQIMTMTSMTIEKLGLAKEINESGNYDAVRPKLMSMDRKTQSQEMSKLGSAPEWTIGSVHAITMDGKVLVVSATGSQLPAYAYGAGKVIWVVGVQKIVKDLDQGFLRIYEHTLPLEDARARKAYGMGSGVNKTLIVNREMTPKRITIIFVNEKLGF